MVRTDKCGDFAAVPALVPIGNSRHYSRAVRLVGAIEGGKPYQQQTGRNCRRWTGVCRFGSGSKYLIRVSRSDCPGGL
jgi:hypothetical protein